jgi:hypothetical protein
MAGGVLGFLFGSKPKVPQLPKVSPGAVQAETMEGNIAALPQSENLAGAVNQFNLDQLAKALQFSLPGGLEGAQKNIAAQLRGELATEDTQETIRAATAAGFGRGIGGAGIGRNLVLRDIGRSVQAQKQSGFQNFLALAEATRAPKFDVSSMFFTPQQRVNLEVQQNELQFQRNLEAAQVEASASPFGSFITGAASSFLGGFAKKGGSLFAEKLFGDK